jgi:integrase
LTASTQLTEVVVAARRRGRGEGSIYRRKDGRWVGQYEVGGKRRYVYGKTRKEVASKLTKAVADGNEGLIFDSDHLTVAQYLDRWLDSIRGTVRESTWVRHEINVRVHLKPALGRVRLGKLNPLQVQSFYRCKLDQGLSAASVLKMHSTLSKSLKQAVRWRLVPLNVCMAVVLPRISKPEIQPLDAQQMKALLRAAQGTDLYALWVLMATTGVRVGEALGLKWDDVDLDARTLRVNRTVYRGQTCLPKTDSSRRTIKLSTLATDALRQHPQQCGWVFPTSRGTTINVNNLRYRSWKQLLERAHLPSGTRIHDLRHSAATLLLSKGVPIKVVSEMLGHSDVSITLAIYAHVLPDMQDSAAEAMDDSLNISARFDPTRG